MLTAITNARLLDCVGDEPLENASVVIEDGIIRDVFSGEKQISAGANVIDVGGKTVMPGITDAHVHVAFTELPRLIRRGDSPPLYAALSATRCMEAGLQAGFTTWRDCAWAHWSFRQAVEDGLIKGPRLLISCAPLTVTGGHFDRSVYGETLFHTDRNRLYMFPRISNGVDDCRAAAREQIRAGADFIKLSTSGGIDDPSGEWWHLAFSEEEVRAVVEEAGFVNKYVADHCDHYIPIKRSVECGVRTIEHGLYLDEETAEVMEAKGAFLIPTVLLFQKMVEASKRKGVPHVSAEKIQQPLGVELGSLLDIQMRSVEIAHRAGVLMGSGTDFSAFALGYWKQGLELKLKTECGLTPYEAIKSATIVNAKIFRMEDKIGTIEVGKWADIIAVDGNPDEKDIELLAEPVNVKMVMKMGEIFKNTL